MPATSDVTNAPPIVVSIAPYFGPALVVEPEPWEPSSSFIVLNSVVSEILVSSSCNWEISFCTASRSSSVSVPLAACTDNSLILCKIEWDSFNAPSAVWIKEIPSCALSDALFKPRIWLLIFSEIESPAASSAARLIL